LGKQETLAILQNNNLMEKIAKSMATHSQNQGYTPTIAELNEILIL
jgi:antitoxin YefM